MEPKTSNDEWVKAPTVPRTFDEEWIEVQAMLQASFVADAGEYRITKDAMQLLCQGMFAAGQVAGMDYTISKLK